MFHHRPEPHHPADLVERMVAVLLRDRRPGDSAVPALQRAGFTGPEIVAAAHLAENRIDALLHCTQPNPQLLALTHALADQVASTPPPSLYPRLQIIGLTWCEQTAPGAVWTPLTNEEAAERLGLSEVA